VVVYFIRHGDKEKGDFFSETIGQNDQPLSDFGLQQAKQIDEYFSPIDIDRIYISNYLRTYQTIESVCAKKSIQPIKTPLLNEIDCGSYSRLNPEDQQNKYPEIFNLLISRNTDFRYPDGESGFDVIERVKKFFYILIEQESNAIVVTHEAWLKCLVCYLLKLDAGDRFKFYMNTCGITEIEKLAYQEFWQIKRMNHILYTFDARRDY
jgi:broad specificity phosphatase PhoE